MTSTAVISRWWWERVCAAFATEVRDATAAELEAAERVVQLEQAVRDRDHALAQSAQEARTLRSDIADKDAELSVRRREVELLAGVIERDRQRVAAEVSIHNGQAVVMGPKRVG
jgi:hypothetical protein